VKRILLITSQYRVGERIYPIIPHLAKEYDIDLLKVYQMADNHKWVGDIDMRGVFNKKYSDYFQNIYQHKCDVSNYDLIISDDNRDSKKTNLRDVYSKKNCNLIAFEHGNLDSDTDPNFKRGHKVVFDKCMMFGKKNVIHTDCIASGIPSNDTLINYKNLPKKHILVIVNFLGNRSSPYKQNFNEDFFKKIDILNIQKHFNLPVIIKLKSRADEGGYSRNTSYLHKILPDELDYKIVIDTVDDNKLIAESKCVISAPSTFAFKPIQLGIPTVLIKGSGQSGSFSDYDSLFDINTNILPHLSNDVKHTDWILNSIEGGLMFNSTDIVVNILKELIRN